jgi:small subunit ribosomal protein S10|uniref:30S ribosomal protein S10, chloroplastic n=1 Tax=Thorea hispida TaxID=202687 RepID=A0A1C9CAQ9_9FLOR|nr:ribosomal protein S10 [Thorea hispida]AOM65457.1 ribosomal protein S10 [Thorea hispida]ARX95826.1 30S ribosomal protein S10 [Thorea hispida]UNJ79112.1 ribosomal protein S10 [Thorea hispida]
MVITQEKKIKIKLKAYSYKLLNQSCSNILDNISQTNTTITGPIVLPTDRRIYCVLRSPHVNKNSREHFEVRIHKRLLEIHKPSSQTIDALMKLNLPAGIDVEIKL